MLKKQTKSLTKPQMIYLFFRILSPHALLIADVLYEWYVPAINSENAEQSLKFPPHYDLLLLFGFDSVQGINIETKSFQSHSNQPSNGVCFCFQILICNIVQTLVLVCFGSPYFSCDKCTRWLTEPPQQFASPTSNFAEYV